MSLHGLIDPFYASVETEERQEIRPGHIWADAPLYMPPRHGLRIERVNPQDDRDLNFRIGGRTDDTYDHPPLRSLGLKSSEAAVIGKAKKSRPVIVLGGLRISEPRVTKDRARLLDAALCVPVFGADQYSSAMRARIRAYEFENLFYLPASATPRFDEGFARLDHVQPVVRDQFRSHRGLRLSFDAHEALVEWFTYFVTGVIAEDSPILEYRSEERVALGEQLPREPPPS